MQQKINLRTSIKHLFGFTVNVPHDGEIKVSAEGDVEVSEDAAEALLTMPKDWYDPFAAEVILDAIAVDNDQTNTLSTSSTDTTNNEEQNANQDETANIGDDVKKLLDGLTLEQVLQVAEQADQTLIKGWKMFKNNEKALKTFLKNRLK